MCGRCKNAMAPKRKRKRTTTRRQPHRCKMKGGIGPFFVDWKTGAKLLTNKDMWKIRSKADKMADKRAWEADKRQYRASGTKDSFNTWMRKTGRVQKKTCCVM